MDSPCAQSVQYLLVERSEEIWAGFHCGTADAIYMCETKAANDVNNPDVLAKAEAASEFCRRASEFTAQNGGKPWRYVIIPHTLVDRSYSFNYILQQSKLK